MTHSNFFRDKLSIAYLLLVLSLMFHVLDEAVNDFLSFYNPLVLELRERFSLFPFPTFSFKIWIIGLSLAIILLLLLTQLIYNRNRILLFIIMIFSVLMILNGLSHIIGSIYYSKLLPGFYSSPFLIGFSIYFLVTSKRLQIHNQNFNNNLTNNSA